MSKETLKEIIKLLRRKKIDPEAVFTHLLKKEIKIEDQGGLKEFKLLNVKRNKYLEIKDYVKLCVCTLMDYSENYKKWKGLKKVSFSDNK